MLCSPLCLQPPYTPGSNLIGHLDVLEHAKISVTQAFALVNHSAWSTCASSLSICLMTDPFPSLPSAENWPSWLPFLKYPHSITLFPATYVTVELSSYCLSHPQKCKLQGGKNGSVLFTMYSQCRSMNWWMNSEPFKTWEWKSHSCILDKPCWLQHGERR